MKNIESKLFLTFSAWLIIVSALLWLFPQIIPRVVYVAFRGSWPLLYLIGIACSIRAERQIRNKAFRLFTAYFIILLYSATFDPHVNRWLQNRPSDAPNSVTIEHQHQIQAEIANVYTKYSQQQPILATNVSIPLGQLLLVAGIWLISKTKRSRTEQAGAGYPPQGVGSPDP